MSLARCALALSLAACATAPEPATHELPIGQAALPMVLSVSDVVLAGGMTIEVSGANPGDGIFIARSTAGAGAGLCAPAFNGECLDIRSPAAVHTQFVADGNGERTRSMNVPDLPFANGAEACFQAVVPRSGPASLSNVVCVDVGYDTDRDGTLDIHDLCPGSDDWYDWDLDGTPDGCDSGNGVPTEWSTLELSQPFVSGRFQARDYLMAFPPNPDGVVFVFHGTGGNATLVDAPEGIDMMNAYLANNLGFIAIDSDNRGTGLFDDDSGPNNNDDWQRVDALRDWLITQGHINNATPCYASGYSGGGGFASWMTHNASSWPLEAVVFHHSAGRSGRHGQVGNTPAMWVYSNLDERIDPNTVRSNHSNHVGAGQEGVLVEHTRRRLEPTRFARSSFTSANRSEELFRQLVDNGWFNRAGNPTFSFNTGADIDDAVETMINEPGFSPVAPGRGILNAVFPTHQFNAQHRGQEVAFFLGHP